MVSVLCSVMLTPWVGIMTAFGGHPPDVDPSMFSPHASRQPKPQEPAENLVQWKDFIRGSKLKGSQKP